jgi:phytoene dehydrogenase-like protein
MATRRERDVVIVGGGHNALVAAAMLARAGVKPLVLEARDVVGGRAVTEEIHPGFRCPTVLHAAGPLLPRVAAELDLERHGLTWLRPPIRVFAPSPDGRGAVRIYDDAKKTAEGLRALSPRDAERYPRFAEAFARIGTALAPLLETAPPSLDAPSLRDAWALMRTARRVRALGKRDAYRLLRWGPMPVADLVAEWFESDLLRAALCARGIYGSFAGPRSAGTSAALLLQAALDGYAMAPAVVPKGGMGALTAALANAARARGAEIRTGARVAHIRMREGAARGVVLDSGEEIAARGVVSGVDPRQTLLALIDGAELGPAVASRMRAYRCTGTAAKLNLALSRLPRFRGLAEPWQPREWDVGPEGVLPHELTGRIHIGPSVDDLERAFDAVKYGEISPRPTLDVTVPSVIDRGLAPPGEHVMSIHAQYVPYAPRDGGWTAARRDELVKAIVQTIAIYAPDLPDTIVAHQLLTPVDLEAKLGLSGGHLLHGEPALDQLFFMRPLLGWAQYRTPIPGLYLCGSGTHPGGVVSGACGANASRAILAGLRSAPAAGPGEGA